MSSEATYVRCQEQQISRDRKWVRGHPGSGVGRAVGADGSLFGGGGSEMFWN